MTIFLSFDVGISNLAYCMLQHSEGPTNQYAGGASFEILNWEVVNLDATSLEEACKKLPAELYQRIGAFCVADKVLIERQTKTNVKMKVISHVIQSFFETHLLYRPNETEMFRKMQVEFVSPSKKLHVYTGPSIECHIANRYRYNKKMAIEHTAKILEQYPVHVKYFHSLPKKDDAADAFLQGLSKLVEERPAKLREVTL